LQRSDRTPIHVRDIVADKGQNEIIYNPALSLFFVVIREKNPHGYPTFFSNAMEQVPTDLSIYEELTTVSFSKSCQICVCV